MPPTSKCTQEELIVFRFPLVSADVLSTNNQILLAVMEGGWVQKEEEKKASESDEELDEEKAENKMVQSILSKGNVSAESK